MPIYSYKCFRCNKDSEIFVKRIADRDLQKCPECGEYLDKVPSTHSRPIFNGVVGSCSMNTNKSTT